MGIILSVLTLKWELESKYLNVYVYIFLIALKFF